MTEGLKKTEKNDFIFSCLFIWACIYEGVLCALCVRARADAHRGQKRAL